MLGSYRRVSTVSLPIPVTSLLDTTQPTGAVTALRVESAPLTMFLSSNESLSKTCRRNELVDFARMWPMVPLCCCAMVPDLESKGFRYCARKQKSNSQETGTQQATTNAYPHKGILGRRRREDVNAVGLRRLIRVEKGTNSSRESTGSG
jgi:hypothetical protein